MSASPTQPLSDFAPVELRPDRARALAWTVMSVLVSAAAVWFLADLGLTFFSVVFALFSVGPLLYFGVQLLVPSRFVVRLEPDELETRQLWNEQTIPWEDVHRAVVGRMAGEPVLEIDAPSAGGFRTFLLPIGSDLATVHRFLRARLGLVDDAADTVTD